MDSSRSGTTKKTQSAQDTPRHTRSGKAKIFRSNERLAGSTTSTVTSEGTTRPPTATPPSGDTTSTETNTWQTGTSSTQTAGSSSSQLQAPQNVAMGRKNPSMETIIASVENASKASTKRSALEAQRKYREIELREIEKAKELAKLDYELSQLSDDSADGDTDFRSTTKAPNTFAFPQTSRSTRYERLEIEDETRTHTEQGASRGNETDSLTRALANALSFIRNDQKQPPPKYLHELPIFDGDITDWIAFKTVYTDTSQYFSEVQNMARLRKALKGVARDSVKGLLYSSAHTTEIVKALERRYGQPELLILNEIRNIKRMPKLDENGTDIAAFASRVTNCVASVKALNRPEYLYSPELVNKITEKLNTYLRYKWSEYRLRYSGEPELNTMSLFLEEINEQCGASLAKEASKKDKIPKKSELRRRVHTAYEYGESDSSGCDTDDETAPHTIANITKTEQRKIKFKPRKLSCSLCRKQHDLQDCDQFNTLSVDERWKKVREARLCFNCLSNTHSKNTCRKRACGEDDCRFSHHRLLHQSQAQAQGKDASAGTVSSVNITCSGERTYLQVVPVEVYGSKGRRNTYALLDSGSTMTLVEESTALAVAPREKTETLRLEGVGGKRMEYSGSFRLCLTIKGKYERNMYKMTAQTIKNLNLITQTVDRDVIKQCAHLSELEDVISYENARPTILIGQDNWHLIASREIREGDVDQPAASHCPLGWSVHGTWKNKPRPTAGLINFVTNERHHDPTEDLLKEYFSLESLGIEPKRPTYDQEQRAIEVLDKTCRRLQDGRFEVGLLWKTDNEKTPDNREYAKKRLIAIEKKLRKDTSLRKEYHEQMKNLFDKNYAERAPDSTTSPRTWYLPHFAVTHPQKGKMRLVFDAAAKTCGQSLNDILISGPDLLQPLFGVILRFREGAVAVTADIKEMFLQIKITKDDRDSLRFLWRENEENEPQAYRMTSVIFGAACSPTTAIYVKNRNAQDFVEKYPATARAVERHFYMDDYLQAFQDIESAQRTIKEITEIHNAASFELSKWTSNHPELTSFVGSNDSEQTSTLLDKDEHRTLGLIWKPKKDVLSFALNLRNTPAEVIDGNRSPTKREITSAVMSIFDPLGYASPVTIYGKILIQNVWRSKIDWDQTVDGNIEQEWTSWLQNIKKLESLEIPRNISLYSSKGELHTFTDASEIAYSSAVYLLTRIGDQTHVRLLAAKARVAPLKLASIPRLELQAAVMGCRLCASIRKEIDTEITDVTYWTDSKVVLSWIKSDPRTFKSFVAHRLAEIEEKSDSQNWRWIPSKQNVADDATRQNVRELTTDHRWFRGPKFLYESPSTWPQETITESETRLEKIEKINTIATRAYCEPLPDPARFSTWRKLTYATARLLQAVRIFRSYKRSTTKSRKNELPKLTAIFLNAAEKLLIQKAQRDDFSDDILRYKNRCAMSRKSKLRKMCVFLDENNILRVKGRLDRFDNLSTEEKSPMILSARNHITKLIIRDTHEKCMHGNHETVINELRQKYWIFGLRNRVKSITHNCQWCKVYRKLPTKPQQGDLPEERLQSYQPPFSCSAIDYFGPMLVTIGRCREKRWGVVITCMTTRAVHLELAASLSHTSAISALRRFMARRGTPTVIYSDNGTNFVRANKEMEKAHESVREYATSKKITWKFIPPTAPHMGGAWERMIRTIKSTLTAVLNERAPREETLHTFLLEVEHIVNSRPLAPVPLDITKEALTPNHFLIARSSGITPIGIFDPREADEHTWKAAQSLADMFWKRWVAEYLPHLLPRLPYNKYTHKEIEVNDVVIIADKGSPRGLWPRGIVIRTFPGQDGKVRIVEIQTRLGTLKRPTSSLVKIDKRPPPADNDSEENI